jgi:hypothetical protein
MSESIAEMPYFKTGLYEVARQIGAVTECNGPSSASLGEWLRAADIEDVKSLTVGELARFIEEHRTAWNDAAKAAGHLHVYPPFPRHLRPAAGKTQVYARIKRASKYSDQNQPSTEPFPVEFDTASDSHRNADGYIARGNGNQYRLADLQLYIKQNGVGFVRVA